MFNHIELHKLDETRFYCDSKDISRDCSEMLWRKKNEVSLIENDSTGIIGCQYCTQIVFRVLKFFAMSQ